MRNQGTLTSWNDEKGFGFITSDDDGKKFFVHINSFSNRGRRPELNQAVSYSLSLDSKGRPCAENVLFADERRKSGIGSFIIALLFLVAVAVASFHLNKISHSIFWLYVVASLLTFIMYAKDSRKERKLAHSRKHTASAFAVLRLAGRIGYERACY